MILDTSCVGSDRLRIESRGKLLAVKVAGIIGLRECRGAQEKIRAAVLRIGAAAVLVDMRAAALTLSHADYVQVVRAAIERPVRQPIAFVVGPGLISIASAHALVMARWGLRRKFYAETAQALRWLSRRPPVERDQDLLS